MKQYTMKLIAVALVATLAMGVSAQGLRSAYFLEGSVYRHQMNPAFMGERNYVSIPMLGNMNFGVQGNIGLSTFLYKTPAGSPYDLTTFMSPTVSSADFLGNLHERNKNSININMTILSFGFHKWGGFNTFDLNFRSNTSMNLPYDLFAFMKNNMSGGASTYNIKDLTIRSNNYAEVALGHSRMIGDKLTVGGKLKLLLGGANANAYVREMKLSLNEDQWDVTLDGELEASVKGAYFTHKAEQAPNGQYEVDGLELDSPGLGGLGMGIDLGAVYNMDDFVEGLTLSASVIDLGFIKWDNTIVANNGGLHSFKFDGFSDIAIDDDDSPNSMDNQMDKIGDDLEELYRFYDAGVKSRKTLLSTSLNVAAEYALPWYKKLTFGFLSSTHFNKPFTWTEGRFYANVAPVKWFDASVNYAASTFGSSFGWILNFHPKGFNFFVGSDHMIFKVNPQFIPVHNLNANINLGFNITFGKSKQERYVKQ